MGEAAKKAYREKRKSLEEEFAGLKKDHESLLVEVARVESNPEGCSDAHLAAMQNQCETTQAEVIAWQRRLENAERRSQEISTRHDQLKARLIDEREAAQEELIEARGRCAQKEDRARDLFASSVDMRELLQRGADELQQLRGELWERQGEKALLVADQASAARVGAEQRVQAVAAEAQVTQLAQALDCEDSRVAHEQRRLRRAEAQHFERAAGEKRELERASTAYPEEIQKERLETLRCQRVTERSAASYRWHRRSWSKCVRSTSTSQNWYMPAQQRSGVLRLRAMVQEVRGSQWRQRPLEWRARPSGSKRMWNAWERRIDS